MLSASTASSSSDVDPRVSLSRMAVDVPGLDFSAMAQQDDGHRPRSSAHHHQHQLLSQHHLLYQQQQQQLQQLQQHDSMNNSNEDARSTASTYFDEEEIAKELQRIQLTRAKLESERQIAEDDRRYGDAAKIQQKLKQLNLLEAQRLEKRKKLELGLRKKELDMRTQLEVEAFETVWSQKLNEYDAQAKDIIIQTIERHKWESKETSEQLRVQTIAKKPKFGKSVLELRSVMKKLVQQQDYETAEKVRRQLAPMEISEMQQFEHQQEVLVQAKLKQLATRQGQELEALKKRIKQGRNELLGQKGQDRGRLQMHHSNMRNELDSKTRKTTTAMTDYITKSTTVLTKHSSKVAVDLSVLATRI